METIYTTLSVLVNEMETIYTTLSVLVGVPFAVIFFFFILPLIPTVIERLSNRPNRFRGNSTVADYPVSQFGFFTSLAPGQVKIIEASDRFVYCIMRYNGHTYKGYVDSSVPMNTSDFWEVIKTPPNEKDAYPIQPPEASSRGFQRLPALLIWLWASWVYSLTGYVFVGIYPFRRVRTYKLKRVKKGYNGAILETEDYSDHFRVADFMFSVEVPEADTSDMSTVRVEVESIPQVHNPFAVAYQTDDWAARLTSEIKSDVTGYTPSRPLTEVLAAKNNLGPDGLIRALMKECVTPGIRMKQILITDISIVEPRTEIGKKFAGLAIARVERQAKEELAKGDAAQLREQIKVVKKGGPTGLAVLTAERDVRTAKAAGDRAVVVLGGNGGSTDPTQAAILQELKEINLANKKE